VWLRAKPATLGSRVRPGDHRPLLGDDPAADLAAMDADRSDLYASVADLVIDTDDLGTEGILTAVLDHLPDGT
jgi:shikimate kinase